jgi:hypothetical protein
MWLVRGRAMKQKIFNYAITITDNDKNKIFVPISI